MSTVVDIGNALTHHLCITARATSTSIDFIENMAQEQIRYGRIFGEQAEVLRADMPKFEAAMAQIQQSPLVAKGGQRWEPAQDNVDEYLTHCDAICGLVPQHFEDRVKILHAAHAALMCLVTCKIARQHEDVQLAILKRQNALMLFTHPQATPLTTGSEAPLRVSKPSVEPRDINAEEFRLFQNPANLLGKHFILSDTDDSGLYQIIGYAVKRNNKVEYEVHFDDCDPIKVDEQEMMGMLKDSRYLAA